MKKRLTYLIIPFILLVVTNFSAKAAHIVGGSIHYDALGNDLYKITIEIYRNCNGGGANFDNTLLYTVFKEGSTTPFDTVSVSNPIITLLPVVYNDPCVTPPSDICIERAIYTDTLNLPFDIAGYYISYQRCCWSNNIDNIINPGGTGITLTDFIPGGNLVGTANSSARFTNYPQLVLCGNNPITFDHSATDPDGDSLVYELIAPFEGASTGNNSPNPEAPPPYYPVTWQTGFSTTQPFGTSASVTINPATGLMTFNPNLIGNYVVGVAVKEYRNGILIDTRIRTFAYRVVACAIEVPLTVETVLQGTNNGQLIEDCGFAGFKISRTDTTTALTIQVLLSGSATNGTDYNYIDDTLILPQGVFSDTIGISALLDGITEGSESVVFNVVIKNKCTNSFDTTSISLNILDYINMQISSTDSVSFCGDFNENTLVNCTVSNGVAPYNYSWPPGGAQFPNNDTLFVFPSMTNPNLNIFTVTATDFCGKAITSNPIRVYNQCPLIIPNVLTSNGDGINDALVITNKEDFDKITIRVFDRWGSVVYENSDYKNDWKATDKSGKTLTEGVYFYMVTPLHDKYIDDDQQSVIHTAHGFITIYTK